jgi:hypothetical protein
MSQQRGSGAGCAVAVVVVLASLAWLVAIFALPQYQMDYADVKSHHDAMAQVSSEVQFHLVDTSNMVLVPLLDGGLDVFVTRSSFESVPYPDRDDFTLAIADIWCQNISSAFLPSIRFRDIRSGAVIARKLCDLSPAPDPTGNYSGTVHNKTADISASFDVQMLISNNQIKGCMQVSQPLVGTGSVVGGLSGRQVQFDWSGSGVGIHFEGTRVGHVVRGSYVVHNPSGTENGDFVLHQNSIRISMPEGYDVGRCPR